ncbi:hypothetical protein RFI_18578 [Reticulomyxa filosa]|uniref:Uncharacterized protein n=1 Tax=Reticulomyxa filosa TaxID=46433 RepID=X6MXC1_RETFI|nr:hypothetical protein RFI_18578 [Reticulomyxa filosa]|eukprot:ETO18675.1 hypothetical protein RFI_18578 [Reticulomyxa filosa]
MITLDNSKKNIITNTFCYADKFSLQINITLSSDVLYLRLGSVNENASRRVLESIVMSQMSADNLHNQLEEWLIELNGQVMLLEGQVDETRNKLSDTEKALGQAQRLKLLADSESSKEKQSLEQIELVRDSNNNDNNKKKEIIFKKKKKDDKKSSNNKSNIVSKIQAPIKPLSGTQHLEPFQEHVHFVFFFFFFSPCVGTWTKICREQIEPTLSSKQKKKKKMTQLINQIQSLETELQVR